jgi:hypothetical protein
MRGKLLRFAAALLALGIVSTTVSAERVGPACDMIIVLPGGITCHAVEGQSCQACKFCCLVQGECVYYWWNVC